MWRRRSFLAAGAAAGCGVLLEGTVLQPRRIEMTRHRVGRPDDGATDPIVVAQLSDLHLKTVGAVQETVAELVHEVGPDLIVLSGDAVDSSEALPVLDSFLRLLPDSASLVATLGNWEYWGRVDIDELRSVYEGLGGVLLVNDVGDFSVRSHVATVIGLDDAVAGSPNLELARGERDVGSSTLLVSHCPVWRDSLDAAGVDPGFVLAGHTHGGQIAFRGRSPFTPPGSGAYVAGWYRGDGPAMYVSRGVGTSVVPLRLGAPPEIACFDWYL